VAAGGEYERVLPALRAAYNAAAEERERAGDRPWKLSERRLFFVRLRMEGRSQLLEVGAGTGIHGRWFADQGISVVCTDLSPALVEVCRQKGLKAHELDFLNLSSLGRPFDAVFAMNCLLHVPKAGFADVLWSIASVLPAGGLFYLGQYGGRDSEGTYEDDHYVPKRFFSRWTDAALQDALSQVFDVEGFHRVEVAGLPRDEHFQSFTLRTRDT
jgi:cyclopropane fatty-acyl-phospholipid synthase-like methyltransferase